ncbi:MAG TPA: hypothetical protein EYP67_06895 [Methanosarcinales archaeon]|nr:hypothetical protein [Methanosarcinales archaeon]
MMQKRGGTILLRGVLLVLLTSLITCGCLQDFEESRLAIADIDISADQVTSTEVVLNVTTYVENRGDGGSGEAKLLLKAFDSVSELLVDQTTISAGTVPKGETLSVSQQISVEREGGYQIDVVLFEDEKRLSRRAKQIYGIGNLDPNIYDIGLKIQEMDFLVKNVTKVGEKEKVRIGTDIYLTNEGDQASEDLPVLIKARESDAGLLADKVWISTGNIDRETTIIRSADIVVPDGYNYIVEVLIWKNDTIVERGDGVVQLNPMRTIPKDEQIVPGSIKVSDFMPEPVEEDDYKSRPVTGVGTKTPGFTSAMTWIMIVITIFMLTHIRKRKRG